MPYNLLLLPLLGGFLFLHLTHVFRFRAQRLDGYRLLVESALAGVLLLVIARSSVVVLAPTKIGLWSTHYWTLFSPFEYSETGALALVLGPLMAAILNLFIKIEKAKDQEIRKHGNALTRLLHEASQNETLISVSLDSRKWYVGYVAESPNLDPQELYFRLLPIISGYRDKDTLEIVRTVFYEDALSDETVDSDQFVVTIPLKDVKSANLFDVGLYEEYFAVTS